MDPLTRSRRRLRVVGRDRTLLARAAGPPLSAARDRTMAESCHICATRQGLPKLCCTNLLKGGSYVCRLVDHIAFCAQSAPMSMEIGRSSTMSLVLIRMGNAEVDWQFRHYSRQHLEGAKEDESKISLRLPGLHFHPRRLSLS
jgi:hypothetical protein